MTKKGPLGKAEIFYVGGHYKEQDAKQIAKDLDRSISAVESQIEKFEKEEASSSPFSTNSKLGRREGIVIMTENASAASEVAPKVDTPTNASRCVTKIKDD